MLIHCAAVADDIDGTLKILFERLFNMYEIKQIRLAHFDHHVNIAVFTRLVSCHGAENSDSCNSIKAFKFSPVIS